MRTVWWCMILFFFFFVSSFFFNDTATTEIYTLSLHDALPICVPLPLIMGSDGAGKIYKLGVQANKFKIGDSVIIQPLVYCGECRSCQSGNENLCANMGIRGESTDGTNCEFIVLDEKCVELKPENITFAEAAAFPLVGQTAYQMLINRAKIKPGENILVWGAGSGVGHMAVRSEEHTSELQSRTNLVCRLLLEKKKKKKEKSNKKKKKK